MTAVTHERLLTSPFDPLRGAVPHRLKVNLRYLQNTLEQLVLPAAGSPLLLANSGPAHCVQLYTGEAGVTRRASPRFLTRVNTSLTWVSAGRISHPR